MMTKKYRHIAGYLAGMMIAGGIAGASQPVEVASESFRCITAMTKVRHFYVDNLLGDLAATLDVARAEDGGVYPPGSVVQLVPTEAMVKREKGWSPRTKDWEFFELDVSDEGSAIRVRGTDQAVNKFGGNCLECHERAAPKWDMICEQGHGCLPIPVTRKQIKALQDSDPRCVASVDRAE